jgi:predicted MFS family arabinose efflux permease
MNAEFQPEETGPGGSYRALLKVPYVGRILLSMQIARIGQSMMGVAIVLFALSAYRSASLAGLATFFGIFPGLLASPVAGALLDRHGRTRLVALDYFMATVCLSALGVLAFMGRLPPSLMMAIAAINSLTAPLSSTGLRSLFPILIPPGLWERANAIDSTGYVLAAIVGPPVAATLVAVWGATVTLIIIGAIFGAAAFVIIGGPDPQTRSAPPGPLFSESWAGLRYAWRNRTLRGLGFSVSVGNLAGGALTIVAPLYVLQRFRLGTGMVGVVIAMQGVTALISAIGVGRHDSRGRERLMLFAPMLGTGLILMLLLVKATLSMLLLVMAISGVMNGPFDIALFTLRQRRTDPAWTGRAFAVSMSFNYLGTPIGSAVAGFLAVHSIEAAVRFAVAASFCAALLVLLMVPAKDRDFTAA